MTTHTQHPPVYYTVRTIVRAVFVISIALIAFFIGKAIASNPYTYKCDGTIAMANVGDSLWSLAEKHCTGHIGQAVDDLVNEYGARVHYGQYIKLNGERK